MDEIQPPCFFQEVLLVNCPNCGSPITVSSNTYQCGCARLPRVVAGRSLSPEEAMQLLKTGSTEVLNSFVSRAGKNFSARLLFRDGKVVFDFPDRNGHSPKSSGEVFIRAESFHSGTAAFHISGPLKKSAEMSFGVVPARLAECLALITALKCVRHSSDQQILKAVVSLNNLDLSRYMLRERVPRNKEIRQAVEYAVALLDGFASWTVEFKPQKRPRLRGSNADARFPRGAFPWLKAEIRDLGSEVEISLPDDPAVVANFRASIRTAFGEGGAFRVPAAAGKAVRAWAATVRQHGSTV